MLTQRLANQYQSERQPLEVADAALQKVADAVLRSIVKALGLLHNNGRPTNHDSVARQILITVLANDITSGLQRQVSDLAGVSRKDLRFYRDVLRTISKVVKSSVGSNFVGKFAQLGSFRRPSEELERASQHWTDTGVPSANKNNIARNPANKDEFRLVVHNYENISKKYANSLRSERESQQEKWLVVCSVSWGVLIILHQ